MLFVYLNLIMSIAEEERQINEILNGSKTRLRGVEEKLEMLNS